jgi:hypothetical protein
MVKAVVAFPTDSEPVLATVLSVVQDSEPGPLRTVCQARISVPVGTDS